MHAVSTNFARQGVPAPGAGRRLAASAAASSSGARRCRAAAPPAACRRADSAAADVPAAMLAADADATSRRGLMGGAAALAAAAALLALPSVPPAFADDEKVLCDAACVEGLDKLETVTTESGLKYKDIVVGKGAIPPTGYQIVVHYVAMTPAGRVFFNSLSSRPLDIRVGSGQVVAGLDEGLQTMKPGGIRRLYIPGDLAFPKGLKAAAGRPTVPPSSPVMFDVQLLYIPGLEDDEE